ncbi:pimeloyl-ACP methyl ester carboxylesterase [Nocardioides ginsengisegetis]|uniref:Acyl-CoA:diacylglycerol acyltransferase n=1 Tax=Nocardioides ginsengisegetis TaxID=661491 RepID=A0A7W3P8W8_9ACTN|nr:alpha/beta hydrolase-fold protein [Nocardioides ginsengisegetis]MBA8802918.1 pimeloyl-ACP methyl ester carboxylesterase [Nocardioides ginsengisegetis]
MSRSISRRSLILGGTAVVGVAAVAGAGVGIERRVLPGRPWLQQHLGLNGDPGTVPDIEPGPVVSGSFTSRHRLGAETGWSLVMPPVSTGILPLVVALHGLGEDHATLTGPSFGLGRYLAQYVAQGGEPFAIATVDGGTSYWHPRPSGEDASAMVTDELLPRLAGHGVATHRYGLIGWSMGGYGALRLAGLLGNEVVPAVVASSPALWTDADDASDSGFSSPEEYEQNTVFGHQSDLAGIAVRIDVGTGDPFFPAVVDYVAGFPDGTVVAINEPGGHDTGYWRRMLPEQLAFLGASLGA